MNTGLLWGFNILHGRPRSCFGTLAVHGDCYEPDPGLSGGR